MTPADIVILVVVIGAVLGVVGTFIYKKVKGLPTGDCSCCSTKMKKEVKKALKDIDMSDLEDDKECGCGSSCCCHDKKNK